MRIEKVFLLLLCATFLQVCIHDKAAAQLPPGAYANNVSLSNPASFSPKRLYNKKRWNAQWIWLNEQQFPRYQRTQTQWIQPDRQQQAPYRALFRQEFTLPTIPPKAVLFITADVQFEVYINGVLAGEGPVNIGSDYGDTAKPSYWYYSSFNVLTHCKKGLNSIAVLVHARGWEMSATTSSYGRMLCELQSDKKTLVASDSSWKAIPDTSLSMANGVFQYNAEREVCGWKDANYNSRGWPAASVHGQVDTLRLLRDEIPSLRKTVMPPLQLTATDSSWLLDYGKNIVAHITFDAMAQAGDTITIIPYEKIVQQPNRVLRFICKDGLNTFYSPYIAPFRFLAVKKTARTRLKKLDAIFTTYPVQYNGSFSCSDAFYNRLWNICRYSTQLCMSNMFFDSPAHQEPIGCTGDYLIESMNNYYAFADPWLTRQNLVQTALMMQKNNMRMFHTSYSLLWVQMLRQYARYTGDKALVQELLPVADQLMQRF